MEITLSLITFVVGFISGMYVVTQIEKGIDKNIENEDEGQKWIKQVFSKPSKEQLEKYEREHNNWLKKNIKKND